MLRQVFLINDDDIIDDFQINAAKPVYDQDKVTRGINTKDIVVFTFRSSTHLDYCHTL